MKKTNSLKKMLIGVTAFCMMFSLVACGNNNSNNANDASKSNSSNSSQAEKTAVSKEDYEVMKSNVIKLREKIINGEVLKRLLVEIIEEEENEK